MVKCLNYNTYSVLCQGCDIRTDVKCALKFNFEVPICAVLTDYNGEFGKFCPICGATLQGDSGVDASQEITCKNCGQRIY